jgi:hypothetical protein
MQIFLFNLDTVVLLPLLFLCDKDSLNFKPISWLEAKVNAFNGVYDVSVNIFF